MWERPQSRDHRETEVPPTLVVKKENTTCRDAVGWTGSPRVSDREIANQSAGEDCCLPAPILWGESSPALLRTGRKLDVAAVLQVDSERVGRVLRQVTGGHVEDPDAIAPAEGTVRDIGVSSFVHVVNRAPHRVNQGYRTVAGRKHCARIGADRVAVRVADGELHRNGAAEPPHAAAVTVDWRQDNASRVRPSAGTVADVQGPVDERDGVVG